MIQEMDLSERDIKDKFIELQNSVVINLTPQQRKDFQNRIRQIPSLIKKIDYVNTWKLISEKNESVNKIIEWIETYFPERFKIIKERCDLLDEFEDYEEKEFYLNNQYSTLIDVLEARQNNKLKKLLISLKEKVNDSDFDFVKDDLSDIPDLEEKIIFLEKKIKKK